MDKNYISSGRYNGERRDSRKKVARKHRRTDVNCILIAAVFFFILVFANLFNFNRPEESVVEKRKLAPFPEFSFANLFSGDFTSGINAHFSDTFVFREPLVSFSKSLDTLLGYSSKIGGDNTFAVINTKGNKDEGGSSDDISKKLDNLTTENQETKPKDTEPRGEGIILSRDSVKLSVGSTAKIIAENEGITVNWSVNGTCFEIIDKTGNEVNIKALEEGTGIIICSDGINTAQCPIEVSKVGVGVDKGDTADFMTNGLFIYGDAVYTQCWYIEANSDNYMRTASYYKSLYPSATVSVCISPTSAIKIDNEAILSQMSDQGFIFGRLKEIAGNYDINFVDTFDIMYSHRDDYIFFKSDHHWTQLGAYYAYRAFIDSIGLVPAELTDFNKEILTESYSGSMYDYTKDDRVKEFKDTVEAYISKKSYTVNVTDRSGNVTEYDFAIMKSSPSYSAFLIGDNPYTVINVPGNDQSKSVLILKDSYGNALVPFLIENFGNIYVVDTRYSDMNIRDWFKDGDLSDILFINNLEAANSPAWTEMYLAACGAY